MKTTIQIEKETLTKLKDIKLARRESYDEIINRLLVEQNNTEQDKSNQFNARQDQPS